MTTAGAVTLGACGDGDSTGVGERFADGSAEALVRPDTPGNNLQFNFEPADLVESYGEPGGRFLVHYTRDGNNAVPVADDDVSGVPDFVEQVASVYEEVLATYRDSLGFRPPVADDFIVDNGGDDRFDVYLVDFAGIGDGNFQSDQCLATNDEVCAGYMIQENDFAGYGYPSTLIANRILGSHEFFHAVQAAYDTGQGSILAEGSAVWATEQFDPSLSDFESFIDGFFTNPDRALDVPMPGPVDPFSYASAIFFQFLEERYGDGTVRALWERCENGAGGVADPQWFTQLDPLLQEIAGVGFAEAYTEFVIYNLFTRFHADPARSYANGAAYPPVRMESVAAPYVDDQLRVFYASAQYYAVDAAGRSEMTARLAVGAGEEAELEGLVLLMVADQDNTYSGVVQASDPSAALTIGDVAGTERFVVVVVNTLQGGESQRPGLCIGSEAEVEACAATIAGAGGTGGAGGSGGGPSTGGGDLPPPPTEGDGQDDGGCGCRLARSPSPSSSAPGGGGWGAAALLATMTVTARRRRRTR